MKLQWKSKLQSTVMTGVFAALLAVLSQISIPLPTGIPVTLQTFAVALCGFALGPGLGAAAVGVYLALGAVGVPVFAGFSGGIGSFVGMTGGYLWAFLPMAFLCGLGGPAEKQGPWPAPWGFGGSWRCATCAALSSLPLFRRCPPGMPSCWPQPPYLLKDAASLVAAYLAAAAILRSLEKARLVTLV